MLEVKGVTKRFGRVVALHSVSVQFSPGEIHAVLGENGAGKSTLMGVMSGFVTPTEGEVTLDGVTIPLGRAFECRRSGIEMIHQHFTLVPEFTVEENLALARLTRLSDRAEVPKRAHGSLEIAHDLGWSLDPKAKVRDLSVGEQQRLEILKALGGQARVLILDEPTAVLSGDEIEDLFRVLRKLRDEGKIIVLIAHKLSEVLGVADQFTVLRKGEWIATAPRADVSAEQLATWMVGNLPETKSNIKQRSTLGPGLKVDGLGVNGERGERAVRNVSFTVQKGEILGIGGVDGNGQIELAEAVAGIRRVESGEMVWADGKDSLTKIPTGYVPQDRQIDGLALNMTIEENLLIGRTRFESLTFGPFLSPTKIRKWAVSIIDKFQVRSSGPNQRLSSLSGGNQQKVVVSRTLDRHPELLVVVNPSRGLDFKATEFVHEQIRNARDKGAAVLLFSTDLDELYSLSSRHLFMSRGSLVEDIGALSLVGGVAP
jgi:general nucleoside transport system ATP-binding protein